MADIYELELALDLDASTPEPVLARLRTHLTPWPEIDGDEFDGDEFGEDGFDGDGVPPHPLAEFDADDEAFEGAYDPDYRVLALRGEAYKVGGTLHAALEPTERGLRLTARQEFHVENRPEVRALLALLAPHVVSPTGPVGGLRWYEDDEAHPLVLDAEGGIRLP
ncbi:hypothetical protein [Streptomyces sp. NPDC048606]|uniref:hypothetical protein n=1 Tax=Streptomyces sp. NPDC048606 TaxID=3154726 RepID=UPI0034353B5A